ncbi:UDP-N-acetylmuramoyl-L-alanine--D-glutamate ligase [Propioniferax innocua]|uniref:UDP-N-acetylmuramoylalanine--D-glutamate ligase n=1 Tax=Propioniferax innocua TaxID=1753 RepID=A0A542ZBI2_9ACTN|nr:UDP-N-acetylmuramoyl-L-alanine--D-glutamate ligase [Propioniferax innocua]TQL57703.1 UDP-N-acetylmuramoylalanine--D-glutamate ligase [Propioniferax innocua]
MGGGAVIGGLDLDPNAVGGLRVVIAGLGASGFAAAEAAREGGARVIALDDSTSEATWDKAELLGSLGTEVRTGPGATAELPEDADLVIASPGWRPSAPLLTQAVERNVPIWSEVELAWRLSNGHRAIPERTPWLGVTGTNGKTTTVTMAAAMLEAAGKSVALVGNIGRPVCEAILDTDTVYDVFVVELSSFQLHWTHTLQLHGAAVLNIAPDHLEWHESYDEYAADKARIYNGVTTACVYNVDDPATERMVEEADVVEGARAIGFTLGIPARSMTGIVDELLVDRAWIKQRDASALELAGVADVHPNAPHNIANALAAAALTRSLDIPHAAVRQGLRDTRAGAHRIETVACFGDVTWVDDSKATNPAAASASLQAFEKVVWVAGGQAKGTDFDELVRTHAHRFRGAVLLGVDREHVNAALSQHAPEVPVFIVESDDDGAMTQVVAVAADMAQPGDVVLLAPGCASLDMYAGYGARGEAFAAAVRGIAPDA